MSTLRVGLLAAVGITLAGCGLPPALMVASYVAEGILVATSGKTLPGHALSTVTQQDCAMWRVLNGDDICQDPLLLDNNAITLAAGAAPADRTAPFASLGPDAIAQSEPIATEDTAAIQLAQVYLNNLGYGAGPIDGVVGPQTAAAVQVYEADLGRPTDGTLTYDDLSFLSDRFGTPDDQAPSLVEDRTTSVLLAQAHLSYFGYRPGPVDGIAGPVTSDAIAHFQRDRGLAADGKVSDDLLAVLRQDLPSRNEQSIAATPRPDQARRAATAG